MRKAALASASLLFALACSFGLAYPASAHAELIASTPAANAVVTELTEVRLEFSEEVLDVGAVISVEDESGAKVAVGDVAFPAPNVVTVAVGSLDPVPYTVHWRVVAEDGHPIEGEIPFSVEGGPVASPSAEDDGGMVAPTWAFYPPESPQVLPSVVPGLAAASGAFPVAVTAVVSFGFAILLAVGLVRTRRPSSLE